jgi:iron complex transport system ATP-binding protein
MSDAFLLDKVSFTYPLRETPALETLSLAVPEGKTTALLGPNGAGKSTLMDILLRWRKPDSGTVTLMGKPLESYSKKEMGQTVALVPQEESSRFSFSVLEYVLFGRSPYLHQLATPSAGDIRIAIKAVKEVGLEQVINRSVTTLSGGEYQLLLLSRALAQDPRVLLLDEPTSSLDPGNTAMVVRILKNLASSGITLFFTTHDPSIAAELADHVAMLKSSSLLYSGEMKKALIPERLSLLYGTPMETHRIGDRLLVGRG